MNYVLALSDRSAEKYTTPHKVKFEQVFSNCQAAKPLKRSIITFWTDAFENVIFFQNMAKLTYAISLYIYSKTVVSASYI